MSHVANEVPNPGIVVSAIIRRKRKFVTNAKNFWVSFLLAALTAASAAGGSTGWAAAGWRQTGGRARAPPATHCRGLGQAQWRICFKSQPESVLEIQNSGKSG